MKVIECDRKGKGRENVKFPSPIGAGIDTNPVWGSESDRFGIRSAATERHTLFGF